MKAWQELHLGQEALGGLSAGIVGTVIGYPLDVVKTRMQTGSGGGNQSILSVGRGIARTEGMLALYKGITPPLISLSILNTITFAQYSLWRELYNANPGTDLRNALAGISCSPIGSLISTVENLVKTQMQLDNITNKRYSGSMHCITQLVKEHGVAIIYKGHVINTIREATFLGNYFFTYEAMREYFITHNIFGSAGEGVKIAVPVAGGLAGAWSWFASFPLDCVRAGVQGQDLNSNRRHGAVEIFSNLIRDRGFRGLYSGASASIARAFLVSGSRFSAYEFALWLLRGGRNYERHH